MTMLKYFYDNDLVRIYDETPKQWQVALLDTGNLVPGT